jgi:uncharacterized integral membrane protein (TIGR00698 family)
VRLFAGILACAAIAGAALLFGRWMPIVGAPVFAIVIGVLLAAAVRLPKALEPGAAFAAKTLLQISIVLLGATLSAGQIVRGGAAALPVMLGTFVVVLVLAYACGRMLGIDRDLRRLLAIGTGICGGSAIAALSSVIDVDAADVAYALGTVFLFNVVAVLTFPALGHLLSLSQSAFGLWAGTAINDTSSVVAAAFAYGPEAGNAGIVVKLTRTLLIVPIVIFYAWKRLAAHREGERAIPWLSLFPWFILWFAAAAAANSTGIIPPSWQGTIQTVALGAIVVALAGVGLSADVHRMRSAGLRPLALGAILWIAISASSLAIAHLTHFDAR